MRDQVDHADLAWLKAHEAVHDCLRAPRADIGEADGLHILRRDGTGGLLAHPVAQIRRAEPERGVLGEVRLPHWCQAIPDLHVVNVVDRHTTSASEIGDDQSRSVPHSQPVGEGVHLRGEVPAEGGVTPAHNGHRPARRDRGFAQARPDLAVDGTGVGDPEAPRVGEHEEGRKIVLELGGKLVDGPLGEDGNAAYTLGSGGVVVNDDDLPAIT